MTKAELEEAEADVVGISGMAQEHDLFMAERQAEFDADVARIHRVFAEVHRLRELIVIAYEMGGMDMDPRVAAAALAIRAEGGP